jgi:hypothetical protein
MDFPNAKVLTAHINQRLETKRPRPSKKIEHPTKTYMLAKIDARTEQRLVPLCNGAYRALLPDE